MGEVDAEDPLKNCPARRAEDVVEFPASSCCKCGHIQRALAEANHCDAFIVEYIQRADLTLGDDCACELLLPRELRLIFPFGVLTHGDHYIGEILSVFSIPVLVFYRPTRNILFERKNIMI